MMAGRSLEQRRELGDFVRALREKTKPSDIGLPAAGRRRTPGLRREEVAQLCGLSVTWYTWLEQGREMALSAAALARLASALRLGRAERAYLFELANRRDPEQGGSGREPVPAAVIASVGTISAPAYLLDHTWTARAWNRAAERLFTGWLDRPGDRNLLRFIFLEPAARRLIRDHEARARRVAAEFRADVSGRMGDPAVRGLIEELRQRSPDFTRFWNEHWVLGREGGERTFDHPADGFLRYEQVTFALAGHPDLKLTMLVPAADGAGG
ncbi:helix-turn-helix transcriptional regulator [Chelativorans sp. AA-79]|uniref:helix-turn-helix transcriptional regulator n=1 Tax=Chelativorans sp. AA-79 TaxID=3028735 RepID=UPI0023F7EAEE|nr:helix-turn-helix transcriptional regulator [Chelativorans sp. AA-79]WEX11217.1 helix-turn-helix transcriptional regulator [Chelativorans sp. AA-79]